VWCLLSFVHFFSGYTRDMVNVSFFWARFFIRHSQSEELSDTADQISEQAASVLQKVAIFDEPIWSFSWLH
jgi:hypothetical protein